MNKIMILILKYKKYKELTSALQKATRELEKYKMKYEHLIEQVDKIKQPEYCQKSYCDFCDFKDTSRYSFIDSDYRPGCILGFVRNFSK